MRSISITVFLMILISSVSMAHPGIGIVCDSKGNIYYTDLKQVWKVSPEGKKSVAVPGVHTHELYIDANDNLYGEHLWYNGERLNTWGHYVWCLKYDSTLSKVQEPTEGFLTDYSFVRDSSGNMYWVERFTESSFKKKTPDGTIITFAKGKFRDIRWSYCTKGGVLYFIDLDRLYKLTQDARLNDTVGQGIFTLITDKLDDTPSVFGYLSNKRHRVYGIWTDTNDNIYVALLAAKKVKRISPDGHIKTVVFTAGPWSPNGGVFDKEGDMWLLESSITNQCRVRKITKEELAGPVIGKIKTITLNYVVPTGIIAVFLTFSVFSVKKIMKKIAHHRI